MKIIAANHFLKFKKKSPERLQLEIDCQVKEIINNHATGESQKGYLKGISALKFKSENQLILLSYECTKNTLFLYTLSSHEKALKKLQKFFAKP